MSIVPHSLPVTEPQLRAVLLAQSIEQAGAVSPPEVDEALRQAVAAARQRGVDRLQVADVVQARAQALVERAGSRDPAIAALAHPSVRLRWLGRLLPVAALLAGLAIDRIANAHRVDLLSPPLLLVLAWNLALYAVLAWRALRRRAGAPPPARSAQSTPSPELPMALRGWARSVRASGQAAPGTRPTRLAARVAADFQRRWFTATAALFGQRLARVLHLCAAAWGAGIALSLLLRGLVVRYQFGWESTFLDVPQVHAVTTVLFWPLTALFGLAPFSPQEIAATRDFAGTGAEGSRWVWMYVGLLLLMVVLPRLALAGWARWRERALVRDLRLDTTEGSFDTLRVALPVDWLIGLLGASPAEAEAARALAARHAQGGAPDTLRFAEPPPAGRGSAAAPAEAVDAVIVLGDAPVPPAWQGVPRVPLPWAQWGESWVLEPVLFERLAPMLPPGRRAALERVRQAWQTHNTDRFDHALRTVARHVAACAASSSDLGAGEEAATRYGQQLMALDATLRELHGLPPAATPGQPSPDVAAPLADRRDRVALAVGTSAGAAAGAAAGAKAGALIDIGSGGITMGAGTALGALLAGTTAWALGALRKKHTADEALRQAVEAACTHYLVIAHQARVPQDDAPDLAARWRAEITGTVAAHWEALARALQAGEPPGPPPASPSAAHERAQAVEPLLRTVLHGVLRRSFAV
ncbi:DUF2868 domain-containing protein [Acidovorax sp. FG27]|uniref:DUF2868 domain-containing protein n=1 Tax=Acidovorax sp. FG27 TaxID=3133652 RepID=UPI0030E913B5